ncbi:actinodefensin-associated protein B [Kribbella sp. NPDC056861]|uniref:actinodefensin-associated protein B n=1 Tax=Kribbella sp. NPDC056861 TaxID=3154857 RepID=UPI00343496E0
MAADPMKPAPAFALEPGVSFARLPFGGGLLVNATTLAVAECDQQHRQYVDELLTGVGPEAGDELRRFAGDLVRQGWLAFDERKD